MPYNEHNALFTFSRLISFGANFGVKKARSPFPVDGLPFKD